jgi:hypothetical protein
MQSKAKPRKAVQRNAKQDEAKSCKAMQSNAKAQQTPCNAIEQKRNT